MIAMEKLPPIQFIPVFEAAGRHLSFKAAAAELAVTPAAVAQRVRSFEQWLGQDLFERGTRQLSLTLAGEQYLHTAQHIMRVYRQGHNQYQRLFKADTVTLSAPLFVAQEILMPHYLTLSDYLPDTELRIEARMSYVDFGIETIDAAVRFGDGNWPDLNCKLLSQSSVTLVCSQQYSDSHPVLSRQQLRQHRLIYAAPEISNWSYLFFKDKPLQPPIICDSYLAAIKAAEDGLGVTLAMLPSTNRWLNQKKLITPLAIRLSNPKGFWFVSPKTKTPSPNLENLYLWTKNLFDAIPELHQPLQWIGDITYQ